MAIVRFVADADHIGRQWPRVVDHFTDDDHEWRTVEKAIYDLLAFGAIYRTGQPSTRGKPDRRVLTLTTLGRAWLDGERIDRP
jgi:hypothetical protein